MEISCPNDCPYLASARDHPPARIVRQQEGDLASIVPFMRDLNDRQSQLFFLLLAFLARYSAKKARYAEFSADTYLTAELESLVDDDVAEAFAALAATYETASRGVLYEHRPQAPPAERLLSALKPLLAEAGKAGGSAFERDAAVVMRKVEEASRQALPGTPGHHRGFLDLVGRVIRAQTDGDRATEEPEAAPRLIVP
ncbi:MAG: hypothetical protein ABJA98_29010 [Acidobacteriota bacterium]